MLHKYAEKYMLPTRRIQMQLARIAQIQASNGRPLGEFLFDPPGIQPHSDLDLASAEVANITGARIRVLGQKRKQRSIQ